MKKSLIVLAALGAFASVASAQSSVTLYGRVDLSINKPTATKSKNLSNGSGSRFGVRGVEDLGGGMSAFFNIEHRFAADTGAMSEAARMWGGRSIAGLQGGFGKITLGREYTTAFLGSQLVADPWGWDTVVSGTPSGGLNQQITGLGIARVRNDSSLTYNFAASGFSFGAQIAEANDSINNFNKKPFNFSVGYAAGPLALHLGYEKTGVVSAATAKVLTFGGSYNMGAVKLGAMIGKGTTAANAANKSYLLTAVAPMGQGEFRASYGSLTTDPAGAAAKSDVAKGFSLGYHYALSKRTTLYTDFLRDSALNRNATGYDFGIKHNF